MYGCPSVLSALHYCHAWWSCAVLGGDIDNSLYATLDSRHDALALTVFLQTIGYIETGGTLHEYYTLAPFK